MFLMSNYDYDVIFIGTGHAAFHGAFKLLKNGKKVAFVESDKLGGTCPNYGCDAKLLLDGPFEVLQDTENYHGFGLDGGPQVNWEDLMSYKHQWIDRIPKNMEQSFPKAGITVYHGQGTIIDPHTVRAGEQEITATNIVIATGQHDATLPVKGSEYIHTSKDFLVMEHLPQSMVIIGAGLISMEFASMMVKAGVQIDIIEFADRALASYYPKYVTKLVAKLKNEGVNFHFNEAVDQITEEDNKYIVTTQSGLSFKTAYVFGATGRQVNIDGLGLENVGIQASAKGVKVNDHLQTSVPNIYASGDVIDKQIPKLTPTATFESNYVAAQIMEQSVQPISYPAIPSIVFTLPRIAEIGLSIATAEQETDKYQITVLPYGQSFDTKHDSEAEITIAFEKSTNQVVGATIYGGDAASLINILTFVIDKGLTSADLEQLIFGFPDVSYSILGSLNPNGMLG
jgi:glutathione reductase (NADPH)